VTVVRKGSSDIIADSKSGKEFFMPSADWLAAFWFDVVFFFFSTVQHFDVSGSPRRCGGQGDILSGSLATFAAWAAIYRKENSTDVLDGVSLNVLAGYGACAITKQAGKQTFAKLGRSFTASDMISEIRPAFCSLFPENEEGSNS